MAKKTMTASVEEMTDGQIDTLVDGLRAAARKHRTEIPRDVGQEALGTPHLGMMMWAVYRKLVEELSKRIVHLVTVDRARSPLDALKACGRKLYVTESVASTMPRGTGDKAKLVYFKPGPECYNNGVISCAKLDAEYKKHGLVPDPQAQIDDNTANPEFADETPNACQWVDKGNYCCATFDRWYGERIVHVYRNDVDWHVVWSFAGVPQASSTSVL